MSWGDIGKTYSPQYKTKPPPDTSTFWGALLFTDELFEIHYLLFPEPIHLFRILHQCQLFLLLRIKPRIDRL